MSKHRLNGRAHASVERLSNGAGPEAGQHEPESERGRTEPGSSRTSGSSQQELAAALRQIDALRTQNLALREDKALLSEALVKARRFAYHDELTGLASRRLLQDHFEQAAARANRQHTQVVLLFLDLDGFKRINDAMGHLVADRVLQEVARRLTSCIRGSDTACRFGGDEFVVLLTDIKGSSQAMAAMGKIVARLARPYVIDGAAISVTASAGMATYPVDGRQYHKLMQTADLTMYRNKARGVPSRSTLPV